MTVQCKCSAETVLSMCSTTDLSHGNVQHSDGSLEFIFCYWYPVGTEKTWCGGVDCMTGAGDVRKCAELCLFW